MSELEEIFRMRKAKKELYITLMRKGLKNLSSTEKHLLTLLAMDDDIMLLLKNGDFLASILE